jgi:aldose sugar dehydrogenase
VTSLFTSPRQSDIERRLQRQEWNGNGFIGGMGSMTLNHIIFDGHGGAKPAERWNVGHRIRDVEEVPDGSLWMLEDSRLGALIHATPKM